jgi:hypothetical protein
MVRTPNAHQIARTEFAADLAIDGELYVTITRIVMLDLDIA